MQSFIRKKALVPLIPLLAGFSICLLIIVLFAENSFAALKALFVQTFTSKYYFGSMLNKSVFLITAGLGQCIALKSGNMNLGGEGQVYFGGYIAALVLTSAFPLPSFLLLLLSLILTLLSGAALTIPAAYLKEKRGAQVLLTSFLISAATLPLVDGLITKSKSKGNENLLALPYIDSVFRWKQLLPPSPLNISFFLVLVFSFLMYCFLFKSKRGKKLSIWGISAEFAKYCGYSSARASYLSLSISGALHALTGFFAVCGTYYTCHKGFYVNMGWNALSAALIANSNPLLLVPISLFLSWLYTSADRVALTQAFTFDISGIVQGCILFAVAIPVTKKFVTKRT